MSWTLGFSEGFSRSGVCVIDENGEIVFVTTVKDFQERNTIDLLVLSYATTSMVCGEIKSHISHFFERPILKKTRQLYVGQFKSVIIPRQLEWKPDSYHPHHKSHADTFRHPIIRMRLQ